MPLGRVRPQALAVDAGEHSQLPPHLLDIWEHAALLYHGYEWQAAADMFNILAYKVCDPLSATHCLVNAAMIQARLGDFATALSTLIAADAAGYGLLLTTFLVGLVSYELGDHVKADACFEIAYDELRLGAIDYNYLGMNFNLDQETVHANLRAVREARFRAQVTRSNIATMNAVPANCIFEAPPRLRAAAAVERNSSLGSRTRRIPHGPIKGCVRAHSRTDRPSWSEWCWGTRSPQLAMTRSPSAILPRSIPSVPAKSASAAKACSAITTANSRTPHRRRTWHKRPHTPYVARDARGAPESTRASARFIRTAGPNGLHNMTARDPRGEHEHTEDLAGFLSTLALARGCAATTPLELDVFLVENLRREKVLQNGHEEVKATAPGKNNIRILDHQLTDGSSTSISSSPDTTPTSPDEALTTLQPSVYVPEESKLRVMLNKRQRGCNVLLQQAAATYPGRNIEARAQNMAPDEAAQENAHRQSELEHTLKLLEGIIRPRSERMGRIRKSSLYKPLPPTPLVVNKSEESLEANSASNTSVATEEFFDKVLEKG
ncbi:uncharacterized protein LTR77_002445 [Saxophila tyrrhenica]|uniref:Uncharacterized protein n=1 Tax=Saxophila tyrrhenica TaxID=1690608 RepID=A0AAV9PJ82_9PEZI|nr:hypothetical protein LTR77_002445 [Saxophila tyrrhenica]